MNTTSAMKQSNGRHVAYCSRCITPSSRPRIAFDEEGVCNACRHAEKKTHDIDWNSRQNELRTLLNSHRSNDGSWDCVVPWSGGKDSSAVAYRLKFDYGMNPLLATFSPMMPTEVGNHNREAMISAGFDHVFFRPDQKVQRLLARRFFEERGNPKVCWDAGVNSLPLKIAIQYNIKLVFYAEHGETEYGGKVLGDHSGKFRDYTEVLEHQIGDDPINWADENINPGKLAPYVYPAPQLVSDSGVTAYYFSYFNKWSMFENFEFISSKLDFRTAPSGRTSGTFTNFDSLDDKIDPLYYYMQYIKFGFGRCVRDASRFIQNGKLSREEGLRFCRQYDHEFPTQSFSEVLNYLGLTREEFDQIADKHRNAEIWLRDSASSWALRYPLPNH